MQEVTEVEVTSEADSYRVESAFNGQHWAGALLRRTNNESGFQFHETEVELTQDFTVRWSGGTGEPLREIERQQWNFSPTGSTIESKNT